MASTHRIRSFGKITVNAHPPPPIIFDQALLFPIREKYGSSNIIGQFYEPHVLIVESWRSKLI